MLKLWLFIGMSLMLLAMPIHADWYENPFNDDISDWYWILHPFGNPFTLSCTLSGAYSCQDAFYDCISTSDCYIGNTCAYACPSAPAHSTYSSNTCSVTSGSCKSCTSSLCPE